MTRKAPESKFVFLAGNLIPFIHAFLIAISFFTPIDISARIGLALFVTYILPPLIYRLLPHRKASGNFAPDSGAFATWWIGSQLQTLFIRFSFFEEALRVVPFAYSAWLRLWGAQIGKLVYWSPRVVILDRPHLRVEDEVIVGLSTLISSHLITRNNGELSLVLAPVTIGKKSVLGGHSKLSPGSRVAAGEMFPATMALAPFYEWRAGRRHMIKSTAEFTNVAGYPFAS